MLKQSDVQEVAKENGLGQWAAKLYFEQELINLIECWPVYGLIHPDYNNKFRLTEIVLSLREAILGRNDTAIAYLLNAETNKWVRFELLMTKCSGNIWVNVVVAH